MPEWEKLSNAQKLKVQSVVGKNWKEIRIFLQDIDDREGSEFKLNYGCIRIEWECDGKKYRTKISKQPSGKTPG